MRRPTIRSLAGGTAGIATGILFGIALTGVSAGEVEPPLATPRIEAAHLPPLLTVPGDPLTLRYAIVCAPRDDGLPCDGAGDVYVRAGQTGAFERLALQRGADSADGRYSVTLPGRISSSATGFSYYAVLRDRASRAQVVVPSGGASAPQRSLPFRNLATVSLGAHIFGRTRAPDERVVAAPWGSRVGEAGLAGSRELGLVGPSSFDVTDDGTVTLLDQVNGRLERWSHGKVTATAVDVNGDIADLAVENDGSVDVLESPTRATPVSMLRSFTATGAPKWAQRLSDRTWSRLALGPDGPVIHQEPSEQWLPAAAAGKALDRAEQARRGRSGLSIAGNRELLVDRVGPSELRVAEVGSSGMTLSWRITSETPLGEVQLAEPLANRIVVVVKTYTDDASEYVVLVLDRSGVVRRLSLDASEWAESAPLARFRLSGTSLYELGSSPNGVFVDRIDLGVTS
jgi:hypothetical protein